MDQRYAAVQFAKGFEVMDSIKRPDPNLKCLIWPSPTQNVKLERHDSRTTMKSTADNGIRPLTSTLATLITLFNGILSRI
nr:hypothetical protein [Tanacetum cinerariifolium]